MEGSKNILLIFLCLMMISSNSVVAERNDTSMMLTADTPVWSDDFADNSSLDDWDISGGSDVGLTDDLGKFEIIDGKLEATDETAVWNIATHSSSVLFGTWSFDIYLPILPYEKTSIVFVADKEFSLFSQPKFIALDIIHALDDGSSMFVKLSQFVSNTYKEIVETTSPYVKNTKYHFDVIRSVSGNLYVYVDSVFLMQGEGSLSFEDNNKFIYWTEKGGKLDSIEVYDTVLIDQDAPRIDTDPENLEVEVETDFRYDMNATDDTELTWTIDDTDNFAIDNDGVITNIVDLKSKTYDIKVTATDTVELAASHEFTLTVGGGSALPISTEFFFATLILIPVVRRKLKTR